MLRNRTTAVALLLLLLAPGWAGAQDTPAGLKIAGETKVGPYRLVKLTAEGLRPKSGFRWAVTPVDPKTPAAAIDWPDGVTPKSKAISFVAPPGDYKVVLKAIYLTADGTPDWDEAERIVTIHPPTGPPTPKPVDPDKPAPIPLPGLRVMVVYDYAKKTDFTSGQRAVMNPGEVWDYLRSKCVTTPTNPDGAFRIVDVRQGLSPDEEWNAALKRPRAALPWLIVSNGKTGYEGPLGAGDDPLIGKGMTGKSFIEFVKKYEVAP